MKTNFRKALSLFLVILVFSSVSIIGTFAFSKDTSSEDSITASEDAVKPEDSPVDENCYRYYFYLPKEWENEYTQTAGIYWWEGTGAQKRYPGIEARKASVEGLFFYDVPKDVTTIIWNNFLDGGTDITQGIYKAAQQTKSVSIECYEPGESEIYPEGLENFDNMIFVADPTYHGSEWGKRTYIGEWYYYYGNGEYGFTPEKGEVFFSSRLLVLEENKPEFPTEPTEPPTPPAKEPYYTVYFENTYDWENVYIFWCMSDYDENNGWPGEEMTYVKTDVQGHDIYSFEVTHLADVVIFTNGDEQTEYVAEKIEEGKMFWLNRIKNGVWLCGLVDYVEKNYKLGDADLSDTVNVRDATLVQKFVAELKGYDRNVFITSDFDKDGVLTVKDATCIQKSIAGLI